MSGTLTLTAKEALNFKEQFLKNLLKDTNKGLVAWACAVKKEFLFFGQIQYVFAEGIELAVSLESRWAREIGFCSDLGHKPKVLGKKRLDSLKVFDGNEEIFKAFAFSHIEAVELFSGGETIGKKTVIDGSSEIKELIDILCPGVEIRN